jgi:hypothetical protein
MAPVGVVPRPILAPLAVPLGTPIRTVIRAPLAVPLGPIPTVIRTPLAVLVGAPIRTAMAIAIALVPDLPLSAVAVIVDPVAIPVRRPLPGMSVSSFPVLVPIPVAVAVPCPIRLVGTVPVVATAFRLSVTFIDAVVGGIAMCLALPFAPTRGPDRLRLSLSLSFLVPGVGGVSVG